MQVEKEMLKPAYVDSLEELQKTNSLDVIRLLHHRSKELYVLRKEVSNFLHLTSHDLRGPVVQILGLVQLMENHKHSDEVAQLLDYLKKATAGLDEVVHEMNKILIP